MTQIARKMAPRLAGDLVEAVLGGEVGARELRRRTRAFGLSGTRPMAFVALRAAAPEAAPLARLARRCAATSWRASWVSEPGPELGRLLAELEEAAFAGEAVTRDQALEVARRLRHGRTDG